MPARLGFAVSVSSRKTNGEADERYQQLGNHHQVSEEEAQYDRSPTEDKCKKNKCSTINGAWFPYPKSVFGDAVRSAKAVAVLLVEETGRLWFAVPKPPPDEHPELLPLAKPVASETAVPCS